MAFWTSLREVGTGLTREFQAPNENNLKEPVIYVAGRPHVLRLINRPLENVEYAMPQFPYFYGYLLAIGLLGSLLLWSNLWKIVLRKIFYMNYVKMAVGFSFTTKLKNDLVFSLSFPFGKLWGTRKS